MENEAYREEYSSIQVYFNFFFVIFAFNKVFDRVLHNYVNTNIQT